MELTDELLFQINAYLSGRMTPSERQAFDARMQQNPDLQREVVVQHEIQQGLSMLAEKQRFKTMHTDLQQRGLLTDPTLNSSDDSSAAPAGKVMPLPTKRLAFWQNQTYLTAAASLVLLVGVGWLFLWKQSMPTPDTIQRAKAFDSVFTPDIKSAPPRPNDPDQLGAPQPSPLENRDSIELKKGVVLLQNHQEQPAIRQLQRIAQGTPSHWVASAQWYLALAYLENGQAAQTDSLLAVIAESNGHPYQFEAQQLTKQLPHEPTRNP